MNEREKIKRQWLKTTGEPMPEEIAALPLGRIRRAVKLVLSGATVFMPSGKPVTQ